MEKNFEIGNQLMRVLSQMSSVENDKENIHVSEWQFPPPDSNLLPPR